MNPRHYLLTGLALFTLSKAPQALLSTGCAQGAAFTYQGRLNAGGNEANGVYDLRFALYDADGNTQAVGGPVTNSAVGISNGLFAVVVDFGAGVFDGNPRWLEVAVRTNGGCDFLTLAPRQALTPAPYALFAATGATGANVLTNGHSDVRLCGLTTVSNLSVMGTSFVNYLAVSNVTVTSAVLAPQVTSGSLTNTNNAGIGGNLVVGGLMSGNGAGLTNTPTQFGVALGDGVNVIGVGAKGYARLTSGVLVTGWALLCDQTNSSLIVDVYRTNSISFPPTSAGSIWCGATVPGILNTNWTNNAGLAIALNAGDWVGYQVTAATNVTRAVLTVYGVTR